MKKLSLLGLCSVALTLAACAPTQGQKPRVYAAASADVLATISQIATKQQPSRVHNFYSVVETTPTQVTLRADNLTGLALLAGNSPVTVTFTALQSGNTTTVSHFARLTGSAAPITPSSPIGQSIENIYRELGARFTPVQ